jgi:hypothetical protein
MADDWEQLTELTGGQNLVVERVRLDRSDIAIEGNFRLPPVARLTTDDQVFVAAFMRCHGSIKRMEEWFGVSYPTIKNRLNRIASKLEFSEMRRTAPATSGGDVLQKLGAGEITVDEAEAALTN